MKFIWLFYFLIPSLFLLISCDNPKETGKCTEIFKTSYITIDGADLDDFYTLRLSNKDTIRTAHYEKKEYPVLTDRYQDALANNKDSFHFVGLIKDSIVLIEPFVFSADDCHINYISGSKTINL
jgi:hypothetical protein